VLGESHSNIILAQIKLDNYAIHIAIQTRPGGTFRCFFSPTGQCQHWIALVNHYKARTWAAMKTMTACPPQCAWADRRPLQHITAAGWATADFYRRARVLSMRSQHQQLLQARVCMPHLRMLSEVGSLSSIGQQQAGPHQGEGAQLDRLPGEVAHVSKQRLTPCRSAMLVL